MPIVSRENHQSESTASLRRWVAFGISCALLLAVSCNGSRPDAIETDGSAMSPPTGRTPTDILSQLDFDSPDKFVLSEINKAVDDVQNNSDSSSAWGHLGMMLLAHDFFQPAALCFERADKLDQLEPRWPYYESIATRNLDVDRSISKLEIAVQRFGPAEIAPQLRLVETYLDLNRQEDAERIVTRILRQAPNHNDANLLNAQLDLLKNEPARCLESLNLAGIQSRPTRKMALLAAEANRRLGKFDVAESLSQRARQLPDINRTDVILAEVQKLRVGLTQRLKRADALFVQNRVEDSIRVLRDVISDYPDSEWAHVLLARGLIRTRELDEAEATLNRAISINPNSFQANFRMGVLFQVKGEYEKACESFEKTIAMRPDAAVAHNNLGQCRFALKDVRRAEESYRRAVTVQPNYLDGHLRLVEFYARSGDFESAGRSLQAAQKLEPQNPRVLHAATLLRREQRVGP